MNNRAEEIITVGTYPRKRQKKLDGDEYPLPVLRATVILIVGIAYGFSLEMSDVYKPTAFKKQMEFRDLALLKVYTIACAVSMVTFALLGIPPFSSYMSVTVRHYKSELVDRRVVSSMIGGFILGTGIAMCKATPGLVLVQLGAGVEGSVVTMIGCLVGTIVFGLLQPYLSRLIRHGKTNPMLFVHELMGTPYFILIVPLVPCLMAAVFVMEEFGPWYLSVVPRWRDSQDLMSHPLFAGVVLGFLHVLTVLAHDDIFAITRSFTMAVSCLPFFKNWTYFKRFPRKSTSFWQVLYALGAIVGACLACKSYTSADDQLELHGSLPLLWPLRFLGGFLMLFGALLAGGVVSVHGITGISLMSIHSILTVPVVWIGCVLTNLLVQFLLSD